MSTIDLLVVGAGPAAHAAAEAYREAGGAGRVVLLAPEGRAPYQRPPLSKEFLRGEAGEDALPIEPPSWLADRGIEILSHAAAALDPAGRRVELDDGVWLHYGTCVLATGAEPVPPPVPGTDLPGVHLLRSADHAIALREQAVARTHAVVVGSGFIGCEAAASLRARGCTVDLVSQEPAPQTERLGEEVAGRLAAWLADAGVAARYGTALEAIEPGDSAPARPPLRVVTAQRPPIDAGLVLLASGVRPVVDLARAAGLTLAEGGEVAADEHMRTSAGHVLSAGDCGRARHAVAGRPLHVEHWGDALAQGRVAGIVAAGGDAAWTDVPGFWSTIGDRTLKHAAWGDGHDEIRIRDHGDGAFTAWYGRDGACVGVLTHDRDEDYEQGRDRVAAGDPLP